MVELPVVIQPLPDKSGFTAHLAAPFDLSATAPTSEDAYRELVVLVQRQLQEGMELRTLPIPSTGGTGPGAGWLPADELTRDWLEQVERYRSECDAADRLRLDAASDQEALTP